MAATRMSMGEVLYSAVLDDPDDETTALAYADWLEENGGPDELDRAAFIRGQRRLHAMRRDAGRGDLQKQMDALLTKHQATWLSCLPASHHKRITFQGGFARAVSLAGSHLVEHGDELFASHPITDVTITGQLSNKSATALATKPWWGRVRRLRLQSCLEKKKPLESLLSNPHLNCVREFEADNCEMGTFGMPALADWPGLKSVEKVRLMYNRLTAGPLREFLRSPHLGTPRDFILTGNRLDDESMSELAGWDGLARTRILWLASNHIGAAGARALASSALGELEHLSLMDNPIGDEGALALLEGSFPKLELLWLPRDLSDGVKARVKERFACAMF